jgi:superfamily II DNA or RNA helicase
MQYKRHKLIIPISFLSEFETYLKENYIQYRIKNARRYEARELTVKMNPAYTDKPHQTPAIDYLVNDKSSRVGLQLQTGCLAGSTKIALTHTKCDTNVLSPAYAKPTIMSLEDAHGHWSLNGWGKASKDGTAVWYTRSLVDDEIQFNRVIDICYSGKNVVYRMMLADGSYLDGTEAHRVMTNEGYLPLIQTLGRLVLCDDLSYCRVSNIVELGIQDTYDVSCEVNHNFIANGVVASNSGKTYSATKALIRLGKVGMIVVSGLVEQWQESLCAQTDGKDKIWIIKGIKSLTDLFKSDIMPEIFICSLETLRQYIAHKENYAELPPYKEFIKYYGIGTKIIDEAHLNFHAGTLIDLAFNVQRNIYLTATFETGDKSLRRIFDTVYPLSMRYGAGDYDKYVNVTFYGFTGSVPEKRVVSQRGYSHSKYEQHMISKPILFHDWAERVLLPIMRIHYINKEYTDLKCLVFCATIEMVQAVVTRLKDEFPNKNVMSYVADDEECVLVDGDIIVSTHKSAGTGTDIAKLAVVVNTVSFKAPTTSKQVLGRIRKLKCANTVPEYIDMVDLNLRSQMRHWKERSHILRSCALKYQELKLG